MSQPWLFAASPAFIVLMRRGSWWVAEWDERKRGSPVLRGRFGTSGPGTDLIPQIFAAWVRCWTSMTSRTCHRSTGATELEANLTSGKSDAILADLLFRFCRPSFALWICAVESLSVVDGGTHCSIGGGLARQDDRNKSRYIRLCEKSYKQLPGLRSAWLCHAGCPDCR